MLESPLLEDNVELISNIATHVSADTVQQKHLDLLNNGFVTENKSTDLITVLGGMDNILKHYLSNADELGLDTIKLQQIDNILDSIKTPKVAQLQTSLETPILALSRKNTFIHKWFKESTADKINNIITGKIGLWFLGILSLVALTNSGLSQAYIWFGSGATRLEMLEITDILATFLIILGIIYYILILLCMNKTATKMIITSFEFWFKLSYYVRYVIFDQIFYYRFIGKSIFNIFDVTSNHIAFLLFMLIYSFIDALCLPIKIRNIVLIIGALVWTLPAISSTYMDLHLHNDQRYLKLWNGKFTIDLVYWIATSWRIVSIFVWRQTVLSFMYRNKNIATLIANSIVIKWVE